MIFLFLSTLAHALEVDEKLTVRILKNSESRKTLMLNRGTEDGLVEGDHAKFIVTAGIVARGVCVKVSPTRSVWSIYRLVNADFITSDSVMTIKISPAVKITKDDSLSLVKDDTPSRASGDANALGIPLAEGAQDVVQGEDGTSEADLKALEESREKVSIVEKNAEVIGVVNISALSASTSAQTGSNSVSSSQANHHIGLAGELYAQKEREWYSRLSLIAGVSIVRLNNQAYNGSTSTNDLTEFSLGTNWHPFSMPSVANDFIPYFHLGINFGTVKSSYSPGTEKVNLVSPPSSSSTGGSSGLSIGFGYKFYTYRGFGARVLLDYYTRNEKYKSDESNNTHTKKVAGPRLMLGISYRF